MTSQSSAANQALSTLSGVNLISQADASSSNLTTSRIFATAADIDAGTPPNLTLHSSTLQRYYDALILRLAKGFRFRKVAKDATTGIWSLLLGFQGYMRKLSRPYDVNEAWLLLEHYYLGQVYWADGLAYMYQHPSTRAEDLEAASPYTESKLSLFAQKLSQVYLTDDEQIDLVFFGQLKYGQAEHTLSSSSIIGDAVTSMTIFIFNGHSEYQAFLNDAPSNQMQQGKSFTTKAQASARSTDSKAKYEGLPRGAMLLWLTGMLERHPDLAFGQCPTPMTSAELERMFNLNGGAVVRKAIQKAKEAWKDQHGEAGLRKDLRNACKALPRSNSPVIPTAPAGKTGTKRKQGETEADLTNAADRRPQKAARSSTSSSLSFQQASLPSASPPPSPPSGSTPPRSSPASGVDPSQTPGSSPEDSDLYPDPPERTWVKWPYHPFK